MKLYKLTDQNNKTMNNTLWGENVTHTASGIGNLCTAGWLHAYLSPELAVILNPIHSDFINPKLWECEGNVGKYDNQIKVGCTKLTTIKEIELPNISIEQKIVFAIFCAKTVYKNKQWNDWANAWLSNKNRNIWTAAFIASSTYDVTYPASYAAGYAAYAVYKQYPEYDAAMAVHYVTSIKFINLIEIFDSVLKEFPYK